MRRLTVFLPLLLAALSAQLPVLAEAPLTLPPLAYQQRVLGNGLTVLSLEDHSSPTTAIQVWYRVGAKDDPQGRSGFAHLFEHLMFKRTKYLAAEQFDRLTEDVGGANNASTGDDCTNYLDVVPSNHLERLLWAEAERLQHLTVDEASFKSERAVVQEEFRSAVLTPPYGRLSYHLQQETWRVHPYHRPTIGSIEELDAATLVDVQAFHSTYYRPDNAALIVVGDFDAAQLDAWIDRYFGGIARPTQPIPRVTAIEPEREADRRVTVRLPNVPLPALGLSWLAPKPDSADAPALKIAIALLAGGESSRLHQALVYRLQAAQGVDLSYEETADRGAVYATVLLASGQRIAKLEAALMAEIGKLASKPIPPAELDKAKTVLLTELLAKRETNEGRAYALGDAWIGTGSAKTANTELESLLAVTAADVQRVTKTQLIDGKRLSLEYLPETTAASGGKP
ncbi:M16 family metallopeptidase [Nevskia ramosa]|uniref:M16 family metallopeptidase n=1 Tax=Nevskia ramosa TaxID=64002 RepID=UPI0023528AF8|nr:pitrilysin family protein [Nevskia ramosa]